MLTLCLEKAMAPHSSTLAWKIPWMEEPGRLKPMESLRVGHDWATSLSLFTFMHGEGNGNPLQYSFLENPRDGGAWWASVYGVAQSQTWLKQLSSSSSNFMFFFKTYPWKFPVIQWLVGTWHFDCQGPGVKSLVGELRSCTLHDPAKNKK